MEQTEHRDECIEPSACEQVEKWIPLARPAGHGVAPTPALLCDPRDEILLLSQDRRHVIADILLFVALFLPLALGGEFAIGSVYHGVLASQYPDEEALSSAVARAALFPAIAWRALLTTVVIIWLTHRRGSSLRSVGLTMNRIWNNILVGVAAFVAIIIASAFFSILIKMLYPALFREFEKNADMIMEAVPRMPLAFLACACLVIGYYEELIFRGFLMPHLRRASGSWTIAAIGNSAVFVPLHLMDQASAALLAVSALSLLFSIITIWRRSLVPAILAHTLFNFTMFLNLYFLAGDQWK